MNLIRKMNSISPSTTPSYSQYHVEPSVGTNSDSGSSWVPPCNVVRSSPSWSTIELLTRYTPSSGRDRSGFTSPRNVSENSHAVRPSGSSTEYVLSAPVQPGPYNSKRSQKRRSGTPDSGVAPFPRPQLRAPAPTPLLVTGCAD